MSLCFDAAPTDSPLALLGAATLHLTLSSDKPLGFVVARLCDVAPDGSSSRIAHGMLNLCHRDSFETPAQMVPGQKVEVAVTLDQMAFRLAPGHHLRLALSNSYWPFVWPSPEAGRLTVISGSLTLPVHPGVDADEWLPPEAEAAAEWRHKRHSQAKSTRRTETDLLTGAVSLVVSEDSGRVENLDHGLITHEAMTERWTVHPDHPETARASCTWDQRFARGAWSVRTQASADMCPDLIMRAQLQAWEGETEIFSRIFQHAVPRLFV